MPVNDPIADMLTVVRNGVMAKKQTVEIKRSNVNLGILEILKREEFISNYKAIDDKKQGIIKVYLKYEQESESPAIKGLKKISKTGRRVYLKTSDIKSVYGGIGIAIISTSQGIMTDKEAKEKKLGGEPLCQVW